MIRVLSLGAGVQSSTVALMSAAGELPHLDACVFADTGWESTETYRHLDRLEHALAEASIPVHRVSNGSIRADALDPAHRFASMPLFVRRPAEPVYGGGRTCPACAGEGHFYRDDEACETCDGSGLVDREIVGYGPAGRGMIRRQCTSEYKVAPIQRRLRELVGLKPRQRSSTVLVEQWLGISWDEIGRMSDPSLGWIVHRYPLIDARMSRHDCQRWLAAHGWTAPRSACLGCPFRSDREWRHLRDTDPDGWADAVAFDRAIRSGHIARAGHQQLLGEAFLHRSLVPLDEVDLSTPEDRGQLNLFGAECQGMCGV